MNAHDLIVAAARLRGLDHPTFYGDAVVAIIVPVGWKERILKAINYQPIDPDAPPAKTLSIFALPIHENVYATQFMAALSNGMILPVDWVLNGIPQEATT